MLCCYNIDWTEVVDGGIHVATLLGYIQGVPFEMLGFGYEYTVQQI